MRRLFVSDRVFGIKHSASERPTKVDFEAKICYACIRSSSLRVMSLSFSSLISSRLQLYKLIKRKANTVILRGIIKDQMTTF